MAELSDSHSMEGLQYSNTSDQIKDPFPLVIFILINNTCLCSIIGLFGIVANIINMMVFYHQGLDTSINISFFVMAVSDLFTIIFVLGANLCFNPYIDQWTVPVMFSEVYYITGGWPSGVSYRITLYITVYITAERCLCILFPLKIKTLITPIRTKFVIALIAVLNTLALAPEYSSMYMAWRYDSTRKETVLGVSFRSNRPQMQGITFLLHVILVIVGLTLVMILTSVLVIHLQRQTKWRLKSSSHMKQQSLSSSRDRKSQLLVSVVATSVVVSYIPLTCVSLVSVFEQQFSIGGKYSNIFIDTWGTIFIIGMTNASTNIIIYYKINSKFKSTSIELFSRNSC